MTASRNSSEGEERRDETRPAPAPSTGDAAMESSSKVYSPYDRLNELARQARTGDELAFNDLAEELGKRAYYLALKSTGSAQLAEDIAQDSLVKVYHYIDGLRDPEAIINWHYRVTLNLINDYYRKRSRHVQSIENLISVQDTEAATREPLSDLDREELANAIQDAIAHLDERHRAVFILKQIQNESHEAIAKMLDIPVGTVWSRLSHAREKLRAYLTHRGFTP